MPENLPWEIVKDSMKIFSHDSANEIFYTIPMIDLVAFHSKSQKVKALGLELNSIGKTIYDIHKQFFEFRKSETAPKNWEKGLSVYMKSTRFHDP